MDFTTIAPSIPQDINQIISGASSYFPEEVRQILIVAEETAKEYAREQSDVRIDDRIQTIRDSGTEIITLDDSVREQMIEASQPVYEEIREVVDPEIYRLYTE